MSTAIPSSMHGVGHGSKHEPYRRLSNTCRKPAARQRPRPNLPPSIPQATNWRSTCCGRIPLKPDGVRRFLHAAIIVSVSLIVTIWYAIARGQDFNWDQQNYHIGIPFLMAAGTFWSSIAPAGYQSYLNPYLLQVQYWMMRHLGPQEFTVTLAAAQSLAFMLAGRICAAIAGPVGGWNGTSLALLGFALCVMAPMSLSEAGATFVDLVLAIPVLAAYALLLTRSRWLSRTSAGLLAGGLLGLATALKLTNGIFLIGAFGFGLAGPETVRQRLQLMAVCGGAAALAFMLAGGWWHIDLLRRFGNPFFPLYNKYFRSPDYSFTNYHDERFLPSSVLDIWRYPIYWLLGGSPIAGVGSPSAEVAFVDPRWACAIFGGSLYLVGLGTRPLWRVRQLADQATGLCFAFGIGYLIWLTEFGYHRYMVALDILCGAVILFLALALRPHLLRVGMLGGLVILSWCIMRVPDWGHLPWRSYWQSINPEPLDFGGPALVFLTSAPLSFIAASLPADARYVGLIGGFDLDPNRPTSLTRQLEQILVSAPHNLRLKEVDLGSLPDHAAAVLASYGLAATDRCETLHVADRTFRICELRRSS